MANSSAGLVWGFRVHRPVRFGLFACGGPGGFPLIVRPQLRRNKESSWKFGRATWKEVQHLRQHEMLSVVVVVAECGRGFTNGCGVAWPDFDHRAPLVSGPSSGAQRATRVSIFAFPLARVEMPCHLANGTQIWRWPYLGELLPGVAIRHALITPIMTSPAKWKRVQIFWRCRRRRRVFLTHYSVICDEVSSGDGGNRLPVLRVFIFKRRYFVRSFRPTWWVWTWIFQTDSFLSDKVDFKFHRYKRLILRHKR